MRTAKTAFVDGLATLRELPHLKDIERFVIVEVIKRADGNQTISAQLLGMSRNALNKRLNRSPKSSEDE